MAHDLVIRGGTVIDGTGAPGYRADVGIEDGKIVEIGTISGSGSAANVDADGLVVTPGFVDAHTHMDAQVMWDQLGTSSCWHGVTTVVMGNCGFTLAPVRHGEEDLVVGNLERAEDISATALAAGVDWSWQSFPEYMDAVDRQPKAINYAAQVGHSSLRTWAMGQRAFEGPADDDEMAEMEAQLRMALQAGAYGFTTSRSPNHQDAGQTSRWRPAWRTGPRWSAWCESWARSTEACFSSPRSRRRSRPIPSSGRSTRTA